MKNILFLHGSSELYGSDRSLLNIVKYIDKEKMNIHVILPGTGVLFDEIKKVPKVKVEVFDIAVLRRKNISIRGGLQYVKAFFRSYAYIKQYIRKYQIDIVDTNTAVVFPGAIAAKHCKIKNVWHIREIVKNKFENKVISLVMGHYADLIVANSNSTGKALKVSSSKIKVIYNAVEENSNVNLIQHTKLTVGMAGRINRWKGQKFFVDAAEIVHERLPEVIFQIAGDVYIGEEYLKQELIEYIKSKKLEEKVVILGQIDNMGEFYKQLDIFVLPSIQPEPFGLVVIEAMGYGIPVIATNHGGPVEIIDEGIDGFLVDFRDAQEMANRIIELINNSERRECMGKMGKKKRKEMFSIEVMVNSMEKVFEEISK